MDKKQRAVRIWGHYTVVCVLIGLLVLGGILAGSVQADLTAAENRFQETVSSIKEQCTGCDNMNLASEAKSLMRMIEDV